VNHIKNPWNLYKIMKKLREHKEGDLVLRLMDCAHAMIPPMKTQAIERMHTSQLLDMLRKEREHLKSAWKFLPDEAEEKWKHLTFESKMRSIITPYYQKKTRQELNNLDLDLFRIGIASIFDTMDAFDKKQKDKKDQMDIDGEKKMSEEEAKAER